MLARLMRAVLASLLLAALALGGWGWHSGRPWLGLVFVFALLAVHAAVLALECAWAHAAREADEPSPSPTPQQWLRAWWGEVLTGLRVFAWQQPFGHATEPDFIPADAQGRRGVLLVHGFFCNRGFWTRWLRRLRAQGTPVVALTMEPAFGGIDAYADEIEASMQRLERATGLAPVVVAHSMGGLAVRRWAWDAAQGGAAHPTPERTQADRIHHLITLGTPHQGTALAFLAFTTNGREMRRRSPWLQLHVGRAASLPARSTCYHSHCDNIVFPPVCATWPGANNLHLAGVAHVAMADHPEPWARLQALLKG